MTCDWLESQLDRENVKIVDGTWHMGSPGKGAKDFSEGRIPGATFFDLDEICNKKSKLPRMMPSTQEFEVHMSQLGLTKDDIIIVYDNGVFSSARVWFMLKAFGAKNVSILNGGFKFWQKQKRDKIESGPMTGTYLKEKKAFAAKLHKLSIANMTDVYRVLTGVDADSVIVDARSYNRWAGHEEDPYKKKLGTVPGHIPGSYNIPFTLFLEENGIEWRDWRVLRNIFEKKGVEIDTKTVISSCGTGVTACFINFAIHLIQWHEFGDEGDYRPPLRLYDGAWAEWGSRKDTPKVSLVDGSPDKYYADGAGVRG